MASLAENLADQVNVSHPLHENVADFGNLLSLTVTLQVIVTFAL